jgi:ribose 5-phosphate isomerase B
MTIFVGADHRGFELKNQIVEGLSGKGYDVVDMGPSAYEPLDDYNDMAVAVVKEILKDTDRRGVLVCGSAEGEMMQANRFRGIRAVAPRTAEESETCRHHHDANILCVAADYLGAGEAEGIVTAFLETAFGGEEKYKRRIAKLDGVY